MFLSLSCMPVLSYNIIKMVSMACEPGFDGSSDPHFFTDVFEREGIPFQPCDNPDLLL